MSTERRENNDQTVESTQLVDIDRDPRSPSPYLPKQASPNKFSPGDLLANRFVIIQFLGRGGMGEVYEAEDRLLKGVAIALKTITPRMAETPGAQERFESEVLLARQVTHPNVCPIYDICYHEDATHERACFLSMKLLRGETLAARLNRQGQLAADEALAVARQIAAALHAAHREGIVHGDIKPANIMLDGAGGGTKAVVMDFGLARRCDSDIAFSIAAQCAGTPGYLAPELLRGQPASAASDLYAFGVVLHEIFRGAKPLGEREDLRTNAAPDFIAELMDGCLADKPQKRCQAFERMLSSSDFSMRGGPSLPRAKRVLSRRQLIGAAGAAGVALAGGVAWNWEEVTDPILRPLPRKRFVALVNWPPSADGQLVPLLSGVIDAIERELSRAEAFDRDLLVLSAPPVTKGQSQLTEIRESLGANLVLASSAIFQGKQVQLILKVLDAAADRVLRRKVVICGLHEMAMLPAKAVRVAAEILEVSRFVDDNGRLQPGTQSAAAYQAFQAAEVFRKQPNDTGLDSAIEQYKIAVERDEHYAAAHARLAMAYCRQYWLRRNEPAALDLAQANANTALDLDKNSGDAHLALGLVQQYRGRKDEALAEMGKALEIDPANPRTLVWQGFVYCDMNQLGKAEEMFRRVLKARPNYWLAYSELGVVFETGGKYLEALQAYRSASLAQPKNALALNNIGSVLRKLGRLPEARESLQRSLALKPIAWAAANMAEVLRAQGRNAAALPFGLKAVELDPADEQNWLELGECYSALPNYRRQAREAYLRAAKGAEQHLQMDESDGPGWMRLALCQAKTGPPAAALATARKAESLGASELDSQIFKAQILELAAQRGGALAVLADCFRQGATKFQIGSIADLQSLRADSRYLAISNTAHAPASVAPPH